MKEMNRMKRKQKNYKKEILREGRIMTKVNPKYLLVTIIYTITSLIFYILLNQINEQDFQSTIRVVGIFVIIHFFLTFFSYLLIKIEVLSLSGIFIWLNYLFHLSHPVIKALSPNYEFGFDVSLYVSPAIYIESLKFSYLIIFMVSSGIMFFRCFPKDKVYKKHTLSNINQENLFKIGAFVFSFTFPIEVYIQVSRVIVARNYGYLATFNVEVGGLLGLLSTFSIIGLVMMLLGSKQNFKRGTFLTFAYILFYIIAMFSGGRMWQVIKMLLVIYYYVKIYDIKIKGKNLIVLLLICYFGAGFISAVANFRAYESQEHGYVMQVFSDVFINNPIFQIMEEFGGSLYTVTLTIQKMVFELPVSLGKQFLTNFVSLLPNLNETIESINNNSNYVLLLKMPTIGGSFVGEMYYSFKYFAIIPSFCIGMILQFLTDRIENGIEKADYHFIIYTIMLQYSFISWVRGSSAVFYRNTIFGIIFIYMISKIFIKKKNTHKLTEKGNSKRKQDYNLLGGEK